MAIEQYVEFEYLTDTVRQILASGYYPIDDEEKWKQFIEDTHGGDRFLGLIGFPTIDIELEAYTDIAGNEPNGASPRDNKISLSYCVCIKGRIHTGNVEWQFDDFLGAEPEVDFADPNWATLLEEDMLEKLDAYVNANGYSYTELNFGV